MKVLLLARMASPAGNWPAGAVLDLEEADAAALIAGRYAEPIVSPAVQVETATVAAAKETTALPVNPKRKTVRGA